MCYKNTPFSRQYQTLKEVLREKKKTHQKQQPLPKKKQTQNRNLA